MADRLPFVGVGRFTVVEVDTGMRPTYHVVDAKPETPVARYRSPSAAAAWMLVPLLNDLDRNGQLPPCFDVITNDELAADARFA